MGKASRGATKSTKARKRRTFEHLPVSQSRGNAAQWVTSGSAELEARAAAARRAKGLRPDDASASAW